MGKVELMQERIAEQRQLPNDIKDKLNTITFINLLISIALMVYMIVVNLLFINETVDIFSNSTRASAFTFIIVDIMILEIAYRRDSIRLGIHAIELLCASFFVLAVPYIYIYAEPIVRKIAMISPVFFSVYYVGKSIVIHIVEANKYRNNLSDVKEILQEDSENASYIDEIDEENESLGVNVNEEELINGVQEIEKKINEEKQKIRAAKKESKAKEKNND